jgi:hypothetical protein
MPTLAVSYGSLVARAVDSALGAMAEAADLASQPVAGVGGAVASRVATLAPAITIQEIGECRAEEHRDNEIQHHVSPIWGG